MAFTDYGFVQMGSFIKGDSPSSPANAAFGVGSTAFIGSTNYLEDEIEERKSITWSWNGSNAKGTAQLLTTDAVGSNIQEVGFGAGASLGSDMYARELSAVGAKTSAFTVDVSWEVRLRRP